MEGKDKLSELLDSLLSDEETMSQLRDAAAGLGLDGLLDDSLASNADKHDDRQQQPSGRQHSSPMPDDLLSAVGRITPLLSELSREDECTRLLDALRPFLSEQRRERIDSARTMLSVMRIAQLLRGTEPPREGNRS